MSLRRTPLYPRHVEAGGRMVPFAGFEMPVQYAGLTAEHLCVRKEVGLFDVSHMGEIRVRGEKAPAALQHLLSNAVLRVEDGQAQYNLMCNERGGIVDDTVIYRLAADDFIVCVNAANREKDFAWIREHNPHPDVSIEDEGDAWAQIAVQGPFGPNVTAYLAEPDVLSLARYRFVVGSFAGIGGCVIARTGYTGEDGFEVFCPADHALHVWDALLEAGATHGVQPCGLGARNTLRLEARMSLYGHELTDDTTPLQAGLGWATKLGKPGGFIGRDAIVARKDAGEDVLVGFVMTDKRIARDEMPVLVRDEVVGHVTSGSRSPSTGRSIGLAYVKPQLAKAGTELTIDVRGKAGSALVTAADFLTL
ncbi:MAG: glycine cleavage system aminomethyltransferase GcvT [Alphaproteobacteria bacterium]|nr:glycine cleavage system aminomethyltransferase GcvT [Alphaproteobacteria bacterium]